MADLNIIAITIDGEPTDCLLYTSADLIEDRLPDERLDINFKVVDENTRILVFIPHGEKYEELCNAVL